MSKIEDGGPAFPVPLNQGEPWISTGPCDGMTLRQYAAIKLRVPTPRPPIPTQVTIAPRGYSWHGDRLQKDELGTLTRKPQAKGD